MFYEEVAGK